MVVLVLTTIPEENAEDLSRALLGERVCACVNIIKGVDSFFWWKGKIDNSKEALLLIKTKDILYPKLKTFIENNHPYEIPEIISFKIDQINKEYQDWLTTEANSQTYM